MKISCYVHTPEDAPFLEFEAKTAGEAIHELGERISWRDFPNDVWVRFGSNYALLYDPMLRQFMDWDGVRWVRIGYNRIYYYYFSD